MTSPGLEPAVTHAPMPTSDPVYLANVSTAFVGALHEAQDMADAGQVGAPLADLVRHARELHAIMLEELATARLEAGEYAGGLMLELGDRLARLEKMLRA